MTMQDAITVYGQILDLAVPIAVAFGIGDLIVTTLLRVAFGGKLKFKAS